MTREKALKVWHDSVGFNEVECSYKLQEAISTAFRELEKEPCEDCISRREVLDAIQKLNIPEDMCVFEIKSHIVVKLATLPSVIPQPKIGEWINDRCSECGKGIEDLIDSREWYENEQPNFCPFCGIPIRK